MVRTNLTIMLEDGHTDLPQWLADRKVHLVASLPCYLENNVDRQRGKHVYRESVDVIQKLNAVGYGLDAALPLDLVYNPLGPSLPPAQSDLEAAYREQLRERFGIRFTRLITITNMPIGRFIHDLDREGKAADYQRLLRESFNPHNVDPLMCRHQVHIDHAGYLHDCDFNYALARRRRRCAATHSRFRPADLRPPPHRHRGTLLRLHGRTWVFLWRSADVSRAMQPGTVPPH